MFDNLDVGEAITDALSSVALFIPKLLVFLAILLIGWIVARALQKVTDKALERVGFDRAVERGGIRQMLARSNYDASDIVAKLVYYAILLITLQIAFGIWGPNAVSDLIGGVVAWLPMAAVAIVIIVVSAAIAMAVRDIVGAALAGLSYGRTLAAVVSYFIIGLGVIAALNQIGVATTVTMPVLITVLATIGGILVVGAGGGLVRPMQQRWERWLNRAESESQEIAQRTRAYTAGRADTTTQFAGATPMRTPAAAAGREGWPAEEDETLEQPMAGAGMTPETPQTRRRPIP